MVIGEFAMSSTTPKAQTFLERNAANGNAAGFDSFRLLSMRNMPWLIGPRRRQDLCHNKYVFLPVNSIDVCIPSFLYVLGDIPKNSTSTLQVAAVEQKMVMKNENSDLFMSGFPLPCLSLSLLKAF